MKWLRRWAAPDRPETVIGDGADIRGLLTSKGPVHVDGRHDGDIRCEDHLVVGPHGSIRGDCQGRSVSISGRVNGRVDAGERITLLAGCHVTGDLHAPVVVMQEGAVFAGESHMTAVGAKPARIDERPAVVAPQPAKPPTGPTRRGGGSSPASSV